MEVRPGYKLTDAGIVPVDWTVATLGALADTSSGTTPARALHERYYRNGSVRWVKTTDLSNSDLYATSELVTELALRETSLRVYPVNTVLIAMYGGFQQIGRTSLLRVPAAVNQAITAVEPRTDELVSEYLLAMLNYRVSYWRSIASSSRRDPNITGQDVRRFPVAYPPPSEQRAIATALSDVDALLGGLERLIAKKRDLKQAAMQQLLTGQTRLPGFSGEWEVKRLGDHVTFLRNGVNSRAELTLDDGVRYLHYGDIHASAKVLLAPSDLPRLPRDKAQRLDRLRDGDLVFADASEDLAGVSKSVEICGVGSTEIVSGLHTIAARFDKTVLADGFKAYLQFCPAFSSHLRRLAAGTKVYATNRAYVASVEMRLPGVEEQSVIASIFSDVDAEIDALEQRRDKTRALKQAMMQELLTGKTRLVPHDATRTEVKA
jgi:type I restriction enzyme, S subunit